MAKTENVSESKQTTTAKRTSSAKKATSGSARSSRSVKASPSIDRERMVSEAAYFLAEQRGFAGGDPLQDWLQAEQQVDATLQQRGA